MNLEEFKAYFEKSCLENQITPPNEVQMGQFWEFTQFLLKVNAETNLTAIRTVPEIIAKHYVDSLTVCSSIPLDARVLDLGCGPGFPSIPIAIARPDLAVFGLDSTEKKIRFLNDSAKLLKISSLKGVSGRAEDIKTRKALQNFDVVVSRAVSRLNVLSELCMPYVRVGGKMIAMKGSKGAEELAEAKSAIKTLGGTAELREFALVLEGVSEQRSFIEVQKIKETPKEYPRAYAAILKKPL